MNLFKRLSFFGFLVTFVFAACGFGATSISAAAPAPAGKTYKIFLISHYAYNPYWSEIDLGCKKAVKELGGIEYQRLNLTQRTAVEQNEFVDRSVELGVDALLVSPVSATEINESLQRAADAGVKIIYVDSSATFEALASLMTDNEAAGRMAGETMLKALGEKGITSGTIGVFSESADTQNTVLRDQGFRSVFAGTNFTIAPTVYMNDNARNVKAAVKANADYVGFFATNQKTTFAACEQIKVSGIHPLVISFDTADATINLIKEGTIYATMKQNTEVMGHDGMVTAYKILTGTFNGPVHQDTGVSVITKDNL